MTFVRKNYPYLGLNEKIYNYRIHIYVYIHVKYKKKNLKQQKDKYI